MGKMFAFLNLFRVGESLANAGAWKTGGMALQAALVTFFLAGNDILAAFGLSFRIDQAQANSLAVIAVSVASLVFTFITSDKVGLLPAKPPVQSEGDKPAP